MLMINNEFRGTRLLPNWVPESQGLTPNRAASPAQCMSPAGTRSGAARRHHRGAARLTQLICPARCSGQS
eukprot:397830-Alexandrium_andersonii.AAC.1